MPKYVSDLKQKVLEFLFKTNNKLIIGAVLFSLFSMLIILTGRDQTNVIVNVDEVAPYNIQANSTTIVIEEKRTQELRDLAVSKVQKVYQEDPQAATYAVSYVSSFFTRLGEIIESEDIDKNQQINGLLLNLPKVPPYVPKNDTEALIAFWSEKTARDAEMLKNILLPLIQETMKKTIAEEGLVSVNQQLALQIESLTLVQAEKDTMQKVMVNAIRPNILFNEQATEKALKDAYESVQPVTKTIKAGEIIVRAGERVTTEQISTLEQLGILSNNSFSYIIIGTLLFILFTMWLVFKYSQRYYVKNFPDASQLLLLAIIFLIILITSRFIVLINISDQPQINSMVGFLAPVAAGSLLVAILLDYRFAFFATMLMSFYIGLLNEGNQLNYAIVAFMGGIIGIYRVQRINQTSDIAKSGIYIGLGNVTAILIVLMINGQMDWTLILVGVIVGLINGILSAVLMIGALPFLETAFNITSMIRLLELSNPNHKVLRRLLLEAPGTYHHSLMVGNLAEASADAIGADSLLVRVGAYYHDIGKLKRPDYFIENQRNFGNPHERIVPALSALIVTSHVRDGVEIAREAKLPQIIIDFIQQHHGTSLTKFFYSQAQIEAGEEKLSEEGFRYEGPKPQSKENALVMLADTVEAGVRSLKDPTSSGIRNMVVGLINDKLKDGQLEDSHLTFNDLNVITESFCKILEGIYHKRIAYPEVVQEFEKRREMLGDLDSEPTE